MLRNIFGTENKSETHDHHPSHEGELARLNRASGQTEGIKKMINEGRYCPEILVQLKAVQSALKSVENNILERHVRSCIKNSLNGSDEEKQQKIDELVELMKKG